MQGQGKGSDKEGIRNRKEKRVIERIQIKKGRKEKVELDSDREAKTDREED